MCFGVHGDDVRCQVPQVGLHVDAVPRGERHPDPAGIFLARQRVQPMLLPVEVGEAGLFMRYADQFTGVAPGPGVVGTAETLPAARGVSHQLRAAVAAHVVESPCDPLFVAGQQQRAPRHFQGEKSARLRQLRRVRGDLRQGEKDTLALAGKEFPGLVALQVRFLPVLVQERRSPVVKVKELADQLYLGRSFHRHISPSRCLTEW